MSPHPDLSAQVTQWKQMWRCVWAVHHNTRGCIVIMKITLMLLLAVLVSGQRQPGFGSGDISALLRDSTLVQRQIDCILDRGDCDEIGRNLKAALPEIVTRNCRLCNPLQAANARRLINFVRSYRPDAYSEIQALYGLPDVDHY